MSRETQRPAPDPSEGEPQQKADTKISKKAAETVVRIAQQDIASATANARAASAIDKLTDPE